MINEINYHSGKNPEVLVKLVDDIPREIICPDYSDGRCSYMSNHYENHKSRVLNDHKDNGVIYDQLKDKITERMRNEIKSLNLKGSELEKKIEQTVKLELERSKQESLNGLDKDQKCFLSSGFKQLK
jgi:hypothetical protein